MTRALAIALGVVLMLPAVALARPRVAVVAFEGDANGEVQDFMAELLETDYAISGPKQVSRTIDKLGLDTEMSDKDLKKLANELDVDAIVRGDLSQSGPYKRLHVRLFVKGKTVRGFKVEFASTRSKKLKRELKEKMDEKLSGEERPVKKKQVEDAEPDEEKPAKAEKSDPSEKAGKRGKGDKGDDEEGADKGEDSGDEDSDDDKGKKRTAARGDSDDEDIDAELTTSVTASRGSAHTANRAAIRIDIGPSMTTRSLTFTSRAFEQAPKGYSNTPVPGARVEGELYPLAFGNPNGIISGIGVGGEYDQTVGLGLRSTAQAGTKFPVTQKHWSIGGRLRIAFGKSPKSPTVTLSGGYMHRMFKVDRSQLAENSIIDLPDVFYRGYDPGIEFRVPIVASVALVLGGRGVFVTNTGNIQKGNQYGQAKVTGGEGHAGLDIVVGKRFAVRAVGEFAQLGFAFVGNGEMSNNRDGDPMTKDVGGAADRYLGGALTFAILY